MYFLYALCASMLTQAAPVCRCTVRQMAAYRQMRELGTVILRNLTGSQPGAGRRLSALSRSVALATVLAPPQAVNSVHALMKDGSVTSKKKSSAIGIPSLQFIFI